MSYILNVANFYGHGFLQIWGTPSFSHLSCNQLIKCVCVRQEYHNSKLGIFDLLV
jgi:hypothetical protein